MVISNSRQYIFFHIPKCGGTTVTHVLSRDARWNDIVLGGTATGELLHGTFRARFGIGKHSLPTEVESVIGRELYRQYFKFAFLRDPLYRFISASQFVKHHVDAGTDWMLRSLEKSHLAAIRRMRSVRQMLRSQLVQGLFDQLQQHPGRHSTELERCFMPQSLFLDSEERDAGRFVYFRIDELDAAWRTLKARGVVSDSVEVPLDRRNASAPILQNDLDAEELNELRQRYESDYKRLHTDRQDAGQ